MSLRGNASHCCVVLLVYVNGSGSPCRVHRSHWIPFVPRFIRVSFSPFIHCQYTQAIYICTQDNRLSSFGCVLRAPFWCGAFFRSKWGCSGSIRVNFRFILVDVRRVHVHSRALWCRGTPLVSSASLTLYARERRPTWRTAHAPDNTNGENEHRKSHHERTETNPVNAPVRMQVRWVFSLVFRYWLPLPCARAFRGQASSLTCGRKGARE